VLERGGRAPASGPAAPALLPIELPSPAGEFASPDEGPLDWPRDHAPKPAQRAEYWLFAGSLSDPDGGRYGFQLGLLRIALQADEPVRDSAWATRDLYRGHLVITAAGGAPQGGERLVRAALGLSGASAEPVRVWLEDWQIEYDAPAAAFHLRAVEATHGLDLRLALPDAEPFDLEGPGYRGYWVPGLEAEGNLTIDGRRRPVSGRALLDRLWGRALPVGRGQLALTRLWLELDDGSALRCEQLRRRTGGGMPVGECLRRGTEGARERFGRDQLHLEPTGGGWRNLGSARYPLSWRLQIPDATPELEITPMAEERALFALPLWSGTVRVGGHAGGWGLLELSNYPPP
jgi:predicted secreted hydrolase